MSLFVTKLKTNDVIYVAGQGFYSSHAPRGNSSCNAPALQRLGRIVGIKEDAGASAAAFPRGAWER